MKHLFLSLMSVLLILALLSGCGSDPSTASQSSTTGSDSSVAADDASASSQSSTASSDASGSDSSSTVLSRGAWADNVYTNETANLKLTLPEGWVAATDEEIAAIMGISVDMLSEAGVPVSEEMLDLQAITDLLIQNPETGSNLIVMFEKPVVVGGSLTAEGYLEALAGQLESAGVADYTFGDPYTETVCGDEYAVLRAEAADMGLVQYYYSRTLGDHMVNLIVTVMGDDAVENVMSVFAA